MIMQKTIGRVIEFSGIGLHTGHDINVRIIPSREDTGVTFVRKDIQGAPAIKAEPSNVVATSYATSLGSNGVTVSTVEHLMAAFYGLGIDNAVVELDGPEVPIMDGSSARFVELIEDAGLSILASARRYLVVKRPIKVAERDKYILLMPARGSELSIDYSIDFAHEFLSSQSYSGRFSRSAFTGEMARARTFGFLKDVEMLRANGLARGGSPSNAIVIGDTGILNTGGLRYPDEFVRHKVLDMMGDLSLLGAPIIGRLVAHRAGHSLNHSLVKEIMRRPMRWELTESRPVEEILSAGPVVMEKMASI
ncbi:MAG: UDP-3-O-acyl-N-acetylglucosamine deacetylase [Thermodesulfobacteriota bacterium]